MAKITFSQNPLPKGKNIAIAETDQIVILQPEQSCIQTYGVGPCIVFIAYYNQKPLGLYHWSGPDSDSKLPVKLEVGLAIHRLKFKISEFAESLGLPTFHGEEALNEPFDIIPIGGQSFSQSIIDTLVQIEQDGTSGITTTEYLNLSIDDDYVNICLHPNGDVDIEHVGTKSEFEQVTKLNEDQQALNAAKILMYLFNNHPRGKPQATTGCLDPKKINIASRSNGYNKPAG